MLGDWSGQLRLGDLIDILVVAVVVFLALDWLSRTSYRRLVLRILPLGGALVLARAAHMYLTLRLLQAVLVVGAIAMIVVFQEEIRRGFERLAATRRRLDAVEPLGLIQEAAESAFVMAKRGTGALIVFEGREPLARLTSAGIEVEGRVSSPLLQSIFEPRSPGHDGAVVIRGGRLSKFAVHLPLAKGVARDVSGTRHAAALGASERSDALVVVVSEEHGDVSVARGGRLTRVESAAELADQLADFMELRTDLAPAPSALPKAARAVALFIAALTTSGVLWTLFANPAETLQRTYDVRIEYREPPANLLLAPADPATTKVTLSGPAHAMGSIDAESLALGIDASSMASGRQEIRLSPEMLELPAEVKVMAMDPERVTVMARELVRVTLPVRLRASAGIDLAAAVAEPNELTIWLPRSLLEKVDHLETVSIDPVQLNRDQPFTVAVQLPEGARAFEGKAEVRVRLGRGAP